MNNILKGILRRPKTEDIGLDFTELFSSLTGWSSDQTDTSFTPGGGGLAVVAPNIVISTSWLKNFITSDDYILSNEAFTITIEFTFSNDVDCAFGVISSEYQTGLPDRFFVAELFMNSGNYYVRIVATNESDTQQAFNLSAGSAMNYGDSMRAVFTRTDFNLYSCTFYNLTKGTTQSSSYRQVLATQLVPNVASHLRFHCGAGSMTVTLLKVDVQSKKNVRALFVGDSITQADLTVTGVTQGSLRYAARVFNGSSYEYEVCASAGFTVGMFQSLSTDMRKYNAEFAFMMIGGNDVQGGIPSGTYQSNYQNLRDQLTSTGAIIVHLLNTPRDATDMTALNSWISSTFTMDKVIDTFTPLKGSGTDLAAAYDLDGIHPNTAGQQLIADTINAAMPYLI